MTVQQRLRNPLGFDLSDTSPLSADFVGPTLTVLQQMVAAIRSAATLGGLSLPAGFSKLERLVSVTPLMGQLDLSRRGGGGSTYMYDIIRLIEEKFEELQDRLVITIPQIPRMLAYINSGPLKVPVGAFELPGIGGAVNTFYSLLIQIDLAVESLLTQIGAVPLYQWTFDEAGGPLPFLIPSGDADYPIESRSGSSGNTAVTDNPPDDETRIQEPSLVGAAFGNWMVQNAEKPGSTAISFPSPTNLLDFTAQGFVNGITIDWWMGTTFGQNTSATFNLGGDLVFLSNDGANTHVVTIAGSMGGIMVIVPRPTGYSFAEPKHYRVVLQNGAPGVAPTITIFPHTDTAVVASGAIGETWDLFSNNGASFLISVTNSPAGLDDPITSGYDNIAIFEGAFLNGGSTPPTSQDVWPGIS